MDPTSLAQQTKNLKDDTMGVIENAKDDAGIDRSALQKTKDFIGVDESKYQEANDKIGNNKSLTQHAADLLSSADNKADNKIKSSDKK